MPIRMMVAVRRLFSIFRIKHFLFRSPVIPGADGSQQAAGVQGTKLPSSEAYCEPSRLYPQQNFFYPTINRGIGEDLFRNILQKTAFKCLFNTKQT